MEKSYFEFSKADRADFAKAIAMAACKEAIATIKAADESETGTFKVIISTEDRDRQGEIVSMAGWDLTYYNMNPVVLWCHDYWSAPIATCTKISKEVIDGKTCLVAEGKWAPTPDGQMYRKLYEGKFLNTVSVGFIAEEYDGDTRTITKQQLLEFSFCPVPANPFAISLSQAKELGIDLAAVKAKGMHYRLVTDPIDVRTGKKAGDNDQLGDSCSLDDGTPGVLATDPKNPKGALICVPDEAKSAKADNDDGADGDESGDDDTDPDMDPEYKDMVKALTKDITDEHDRHTKALNAATDKMEEEMGDLAGEQDGKSAADAHTAAVDNFRKTLALEGDKHRKCMKEAVKTYTAALAKKLADDGAAADEKNIGTKVGATLSKATKEEISKIKAAITEAIAICDSLVAGGEGKDDAKEDDDEKKPEEGGKSAADSKGTPNNRSNRAGATDMDDFVMGRTILRGLQRSVESALSTYNDRARNDARKNKKS